MTKHSLTIFLLILIGLSAQGFAQIDIRNKIEQWYKSARFVTADTDKNKMLSKEELGLFPDEFIFYFNKENFTLADLDKNGMLDSLEMEKKWDSERSLRDIFEKQKIRTLNTTYLSLPIADTKYLKENPELVVELMKNAFWLNDNAYLTGELLKKKRFITENQGIMEAVNRNLYWLAQNPEMAGKLYDYCSIKTVGPEIVKWRELHRKFLRDNRKPLSILYGRRS